jgi:putative ABC transport system permease protein
VVGVVKDLHDDGIDQKTPAIVYWPLLQRTPKGELSVIRGLSYLIRTPRAGTLALLPDLEKAVARINPTLPVANVRTMQSIYEESLSRTSFTLALLAVAGSMALLLGVIGIYGVISYSVSQRRREIGIRLALGAPVPAVTRAFVRQGLWMSFAGLIAGLPGALALTHVMKSLLFGVDAADPLTYVTASLSLLVAALGGSYLPARRASRADAMETLRVE